MSYRTIYNKYSNGFLGYEPRISSVKVSENESVTRYGSVRRQKSFEEARKRRSNIESGNIITGDTENILIMNQ